MSLTAKAAWIIERNCDRDLDAGKIASAVGVSKFHLAHAFAASTGIPVMAHVRGRRLTKAAEALAQGAPDILQVALAAGYGSHEAFTRAFRAMLEVTPEDVRRRGTLEGLALVRPLPLPDVEPAKIGTPRIVESGEIRAVGLTRAYRLGHCEGIAGQWQAFMAIAGEIENRLPVIPLSIVGPGDGEGGFDYTAAVEVSAFAGRPKLCACLHLPAARYAVFAHTEHVTLIGRTYAAIWNDWLPGSGHQPAEAASLERHSPAFDPRTGEGDAEIWIPLMS